MSNSDAETEESTECPTCGKADFASEHGMKVHHKAVHGESLSTEHVECHHCENTFNLPKWHRERADRHFCTEACRAGWLSEANSGEHHPQWIVKGVDFECEWCGDEFRRTPSQTNSGRFCSHGCYIEWFKETGRVEHTCDQCGVTFTTPKGDDRKGRFCGNDCYYLWRSENNVGGPILTGEDHPQWKGGYTQHRGTDWPKLREKALQADDYQCQGCGWHDDDHRDEHGVGLHVHHIRPVTSFENPADADTVGNLVPLCRDCHGKWEGVPLRPRID